MDGWPINLFDTAVILIVLLSGGLAFMRGFTHEVLSLLAWVGAAAATYVLFPNLRPYGQNLISPSWLADGATGLVIFVPFLVVLWIISHSLSQQVKSSNIGALDRTLGFIFGLGRGAVIVAILFLGLGWLTPMEPSPPAWLRGARTLPLVKYESDLFLSLNPNPATPAPAPRREAPATDTEAKQAPDSDLQTGYKTLQRRAIEQLIERGDEAR